MERVDILIIGAGVVGLAIAAELSNNNKFCNNDIILLERRDSFGQETSSRNSEVIHAGIFYPEDSLKAKLCVQGKELLYEFCKKWDVPYQCIGKLVVARDNEEIEALKSVMVQGENNAVTDLQYLSEADIKRYEPNINAKAAILSPSTGIIHTHRLMERLAFLAIQGGVMMGYRHEVLSVRPEKNAYLVTYQGPDRKEETISCNWIINSAGLGASQIASSMGIEAKESSYQVYLCKAEYFALPNAKSSMVKRLIYPVPTNTKKFKHGHLTKTLDGSLKLGPSSFYVDKIDYSVDENHAKDFYHQAKSYLPFLDPFDLTPDMAGIRPKLQAPGAPFRDFIINHEIGRGLRGVINLIGIESPGLTSCLSIARMIANLMDT